MQLIARLGEHRPDRDRAATRRSTRLHAGLRPLGVAGSDVLVHDLSTDGFQVEGDIALPLGAFVWLRLPGMTGLNARVVWAQNGRYGCEFLVPIAAQQVSAMIADDGPRGSALAN